MKIRWRRLSRCGDLCLWWWNKKGDRLYCCNVLLPTCQLLTKEILQCSVKNTYNTLWILFTIGGPWSLYRRVSSNCKSVFSPWGSLASSINLNICHFLQCHHCLFFWRGQCVEVSPGDQLILIHLLDLVDILIPIHLQETFLTLNIIVKKINLSYLQKMSR